MFYLWALAPINTNISSLKLINGFCTHFLVTNRWLGEYVSEVLRLYFMNCIPFLSFCMKRSFSFSRLIHFMSCFFVSLWFKRKQVVYLPFYAGLEIQVVKPVDQ